MAIRTPLPPCWLLAAAALCLAGEAVAQADPIAELEAMSQASGALGSGMALARRQVAAGELAGALATLERVLIRHPESDAALLLHASLLCRLDDREGAMLELDAVRDRTPDRQAWAEASAACAARQPRGGR